MLNTGSLAPMSLYTCVCAEHSAPQVNMEGRTILLYHLSERDNAVELQFQPRYGSIVAYKWFGDG